MLNAKPAASRVQTAQQQQPRGAPPHLSPLSIRHQVAMGAASLVLLASNVAPALAEQQLPPIDTSDPNRCESIFSAIEVGKGATRSGQVTTAVSGKALDVRQCSLPGAKLPSRVLSGALFDEANFKGSDLHESRLSKSTARDADFSRVDFSNALVDRIDFTRSNLAGTNFFNAFVTGSNFERADLSDTNFEYALFGKEDIKKACANPTLQGESREQVGCPL